MKEREPGFLYGVGVVDIVKIGLAFLLSLAGFYLIWRMLFGPPMFAPSTVQAELRSLAPKQHQPPPPPVNQGNQTMPGEISVGIAPSNPPPKK